MSARPVQGQSVWTREKVAAIRASFAANTAIVRAIAHKQGRAPTYWHFDLFAGCGWNEEEEVDLPGSPLVFLEEAREHLPGAFWMHCAEHNPEQVAKLQFRLSRHPDWNRCFVHAGDNAGLLPAIPDIIRQRDEHPRYALGSAFIDPNDLKVDWERIAEFSAACPRIDLIANLSATAFKRVDGALGTGFRVQDALDHMGKQFWWVRQAAGPQQWTVLLGRNWKPRGSMRSHGFAPLDSDEGQRIFARLQHTSRELEANDELLRAERQPSLFGAF